MFNKSSLVSTFAISAVLMMGGLTSCSNNTTVAKENYIVYDVNEGDLSDPAVQKPISSSQNLKSQGIQVNSVRKGGCSRGSGDWYYQWVAICNLNAGYPVYMGGGYNGNFNVHLTYGPSASIRFYRYTTGNGVFFFHTQFCELSWQNPCKNPWPDSNVGIQMNPHQTNSTTWFEIRPS